MNLYTHTTGSGPAIIILHGLYGCSDNWGSIARGLGAHFTVHSPDLRNHGRSPHHPEHTYPAMAGDVAEWMNTHHVEQAVVLGHSMGGKVASVLAATHPERIKALILVDIAPMTYIPGPRLSEALAQHRALMESLRALPIKQMESRHDAEQELSRSVPGKQLRQFLLKNLYRDNSAGFRWKLNLEVLYHSLPHILGGVGEPPAFSVLKDTPVLCIRGELSQYVGSEEKELLRLAFPDIKIVDIPRAGHWVHAEQPELFLQTVTDFLKSGTNTENHR